MLHHIRDKAADALYRADRQDRFVEEVLAAIYPSGLDTAERAFLTELTYGTIRWRATLDHVIRRYRPRGRLKGRLRWILRVALFQMGFLTNVPDRVAVDAAVEQAKSSFGSGGGRLANAILRRAQSEWTQRPTLPQESPDPLRDVPCATGAVWRGPAGVFPDPSERRVANVALRYSLPEWLLERWVAEHGEPRLIGLAEAQNRRPGLHCWVDPAAGDPAAVRAALESDGIGSEPTGVGFRVTRGSGRVVGSVPFREGKILIQDETAATVVPFLEPEPGDRILEIGAAPGTKTVQLARAVGGRGRVVAVDRSPRRLRLLQENARRFGLESRVDVVAADATALPERWRGAFDRVLIDAPCSNTGVLARRPEARWRLKPGDIARLAEVQQAMLQGGLRALRAGGGRLVYSTCSIESEENGSVIRSVGDRAHAEAEELTLPDSRCDGGYKARLMKN
jgi:16S rRNA (cytosine967-C5)-methyltransferase